MKVEAEVSSPKRYHHGDLRRALLDAAIMIVERDGANALTLRAVAREAGVSPAAPYHHFKDKNDLLHDVAVEGFRRQQKAMTEAVSTDSPHAIGIAAVEFARAHPALYRVMYDCARDMERLPYTDELNTIDGTGMMRDALIKAAGGDMNEIDLGLSVIAAWCAAHGLAELSSFTQFKPIKDALGGERAFLTAIFDRLGYSRPQIPKKPID